MIYNRLLLRDLSYVIWFQIKKKINRTNLEKERIFKENLDWYKNWSYKIIFFNYFLILFLYLKLLHLILS